MTIMATAYEERSKKKTRYMSRWECSLYNKDRSNSTRSMSLKSLFGIDADSDGNRNLESRITNSNSIPTPFFTFRLEHRKGGTMAKHVGEERILLFRSDRPGAIAKIIYSSIPSSTNNITHEGESAIHRRVQAKVHVLEVKEDYRGYDFGGLLFCEAMASLRRRYMECDSGSSICCDLDAEEDTRRHNRLVEFYQRLGCYVKPMAKCQYINNNDGETYRKIPMQIALRLEDNHINTGNYKKSDQINRVSKGCAIASSLIGYQGGFLPLQLFESPGKRLCDYGCIIIDDSEGFVEIHTTKGRRLEVDSEGRCTDHDIPELVKDDGTDGAIQNRNHKFLLFRVSDENQNVLSGDDVDETTTSNADRCNELWLVQSCGQGHEKSYLNYDAFHRSLQCSKTPAFWQASRGGYSLTWTKDTPPRRQHYRRAWSTQTFAYVQSMQEKYLKFALAKMTLKEALDLVKSQPGFPFRLDDSSRSLSLRTRCFRTAEAARAGGHPDWIQLIALVHALGGVVKHIDIASEIAAEDDYDWTIPSRSRVIGCPAPPNATFDEFRCLNKDEQDERYISSPLGIYTSNCGLENVKLSWTGPEYMYHMLKHNGVSVPEEGLTIIRCCTLSDWHSKGYYDWLANDDDLDVQPFVQDFDHLCRNSSEETLKYGVEMTDEECNNLWNTYYSTMVAKYLADDVLLW